MAIVVGKIMLLFFVSSWIIIHLGINPVSGGSPPNDIMVVKMRIAIIGDLFHVWDNDSVVVADEWIKSMNVEIVMVI